MSAARKKGKWTGGSLVLGYDVDPRAKRLTINPPEADQARAIFALFERHRSVRLTLEEVERRGWRLKQWTCRSGKVHGGGPFTENSLRRMLGSALYAGNVRYKGTIYPGEHEAIVDPAIWERVQSLIEHYAQETSPRQRHTALLRGLLHCEACGVPMIPVHVGRHFETPSDLRESPFQNTEINAVDDSTPVAFRVQKGRKLGAPHRGNFNVRKAGLPLP